MECYCNNNFKNAIILVRGNDTNFNDATGIKIYINTTVLDLSTFKAVFKLGNITKTFDDISSGEIELNFTAAETAPLQAECWGTLNLIDNSKRVATIENRIPFKVISIVDGNAIATQPYTLNFDVKQGGETILNISIESAVTVEVGTTTTLPPGSEATVTNAGTPNHLILDFGIPRGYDPIWGHIEGDIMEQQDLQDELASISGGLADSITALDDKFTSITGGLDDKIDSVNGALSDSISGLDNKYDSITGALSDSITGLDNKYDSITGALSDSISAVDDKYNSITGGLSDDIDALESVVSANFTTLSDSISAETTARINADSIIGDSITALDNKYSSITGGLSDSITALDSVVSSNFTTLSDSIVALDSIVSDNYTTLDGKIDSINGALSDSITALDSVVSSNFTTLSDSIVALDSIVSDNFTTLSDSITNNYNTLDSLIGGVDDKIDVHIADKANPHEVTASQVGLGNVDNTSDADKPISTAQQTALDGKVDKLVSKPTAGTYTKVTITSEGLVSNGDTLTASDIPSLNLTKISDVTSTYTEVNQLHESGVVKADFEKLHDVTASASEVNILDGATLSTTELNYVDGVTSSIQTQLNNKLEKKPDGTNDLIDNNNKINLLYVPDVLLGQVIYAGVFNGTTAVATLTTNAKTKLGTTANTITLTNDTTAITGYEDNEGCFYICNTDGTFASISFLVGDWLLSTGSGWSKVDNTDAVTGVKGNAESTYRIGNVNITADNVLPTQSGNTGKFLKTDGTNATWGAAIVSILEGSANGTISVDGSDVAVHGLGSAAYTSSSDYATSIQGGLADSAVQSVTTGSSNGTISVDGTDVSVYGLGSAAYTASSAYATSIQGGLADSAIQTVKVNGSALTPDANKAVDVTVPTKISDLSDDTSTYPIDKADTLTGLTATITELNYCDGVTSAIQTQLNGKQASITGGASTITSSDLSASKALVSNASGKVDVSTVTSTELGYVSGVTSAIQTQLNGKLTTSDIVSSVSSSSTNSKAVGAKLFYDTCGDIETLINAL